MNDAYLRNVIEAALLAAGRSLPLTELAQLFEEGARPGAEELRAAVEALAGEYAERGIEIKETAAGFRIQVRRELANEISRLWPERPARYSRALLETLALIAYRQPITRAEIEAVRGVAVNPNILKTMIERNWVRVVGHRDVPGRPELLGTTREFLDYFGLKNLDELPPLAQLKAMGDITLQLELGGADAAGAAAEAVTADPSTSTSEGAEADGDSPGEDGESTGLAEAEALAPESGSAADTEGLDAEAADTEEPDSDELSAEGDDSHELVAGPRDLDD
jgi:segregation and condensation protein B